MHIAEVRDNPSSLGFKYGMFIDGEYITGSAIRGYIKKCVDIFNDICSGRPTTTMTLVKRLRDKIKRGDCVPTCGQEVIDFIVDLQAGKNMHGHLFSWQQGGSTRQLYHIPDVPEVCGTDENYSLAGDDVDTFGIGSPRSKSTKPWTPDTVDPSVDVMDIIHQVCGRPMK